MTTCKHCLQGGLFWKKDNKGKWHLNYEDGSKHNCYVLKQEHIRLAKLKRAYS